MLARKKVVSPELEATAHKRLHNAGPMPRGAAALVSPRQRKHVDEARPQTAKPPTYHP